jgi:L-lactate utilization protein LutC
VQQIDKVAVVPNETGQQQSIQWKSLPDLKTVERTMEALGQRGIHAEFVTDKQKALSKLVELIPAGAEVMTASSRTLEEIGFLQLLKSNIHGWKNLKSVILAEADPAKQMQLRARSVLSEYFLGSVHAITQAGEVVTASASGSQLSAYAFTSRNVVWVVGTQKIVSTLEEGLRRVREYSLPLEEQRMKSVGYPGSFVGKMLIFERETPRRNVNLIFVNELLGF